MTEQLNEDVFQDNEWAAIVRQLKIPQRQSQVLKMLFNGHSDKQIARDLDIAMPTVRTYMNRLFARFNVQDRHELILHVFAHFRKGCRTAKDCPWKKL
jgi:DNA-binding NarL/FixJ family response regulator